MIPPGVPPDRERWPPGLLTHLTRFKQGDLVKGFPVVYIGDPDVAAHLQTAAYAGEGAGPIEFEPFDYGMIVTQTCDLREEDSTNPSRPWVQIAPVYDGLRTYLGSDGVSRKVLHGGIRNMLESGGGQLYLMHLPHFGTADEFWVADFRLTVPVDKGWLLGKEPVNAFESEEERRKVGMRTAMQQIRPAFDGRFVEAVQQPLISALKTLAKEDPELSAAIHRETHQFGMRSAENVVMAYAEVWILSLVPLTDTVRVWLDDQSETWHRKAAELGLNLLPTQYRELRSTTAQEYVSLTVVPLSHLSPHPLWYGSEGEFGD